MRELEDCFVFPDQSGGSVGGKLYKLLFKHKLAEVHLALSQDPWIRNQVKPLHKQQQVVNDPNIRPQEPITLIFLAKKRESYFRSDKILF